MIDCPTCSGPHDNEIHRATACIENYLRALGLACLEAADKPRMRPLLFAVLLLAPKTIAELRRLAA
jgi:hypothetical protein